MRTRLVTGFPGFLGSALVERLLRRAPEGRVVCLVQPAYHGAAHARAASLPADLAARLTLAEGDVTRPDLGLGSERRALLPALHEVYHLAAAYDLGVDAATAERVNVDGTRHVLALCADAPHLERLHYMSTCYVSGRHAGPFGEGDLDVGQAFHNHYEASKFRAEVAVHEAMAAGLGATVYRPSIVVGDATTGATQKLDGPYALLMWMLRWRGVAVVPVAGDPRRHRLNLVPRDWVIDALDYLSARPGTRGAVLHLCDPDAPTVDEVLRCFADAADRRLVRVPLPLPLLQQVLRLPGVAAWSGLRPETVPYVVHPARYTAEHTRQALRDAPFRLPRLADYAERLVAYLRAHPELARTGMA